MKLYFHPISTYSQKALLALYEKDLEFEPSIVQLMDPEANAAYREVYPLGKIPLLTLADGYKVPESTIIVEYIEGHYADSGARLIPDGVDAARRVRFIDRMNDLYLNDPVATLLFQSWKPEAERNPELIDKSTATVNISYGYLDSMLAGNRWLAGDAFTMADCSAIPPLFYAQEVLPFSEHEHISRYWQMALERPSVQRVFAEAKPHLERMAANRA